MSDTYGVSAEAGRGGIEAPVLPYQPRRPQNPNIPIALVGCGGVSRVHLQAYRNGGFNVVALCSRSLERANSRREEFYPDAAVTTDLQEILRREDVQIVDLTAHPDVRPPMIEAALRAGKHVLSQKPFVLDRDTGKRLADLADEKGVKLAINQNGRWAPHFSYIREAVTAGLIGEVSTVDFTVHWDHHWIVGTEFEKVKHLLLYDFAIHWFDMAMACLAPRNALSVYASARRSWHQRAEPPFLAHAAIEFEHGQATIALNAACTFGQEDRTTVIGNLGTIRSAGPGLLDQTISIHTRDGTANPSLSGKWFPDGFQGSMAELICAIEEHREPIHSARANLRSLALCFAALRSAEHGEVVPVTY